MPGDNIVVSVRAIITNIDGSHSILVGKRKKNPGNGCYALPGGVVKVGERCTAAVYREVMEETGLDVLVNRSPLFVSEDIADPKLHSLTLWYIAVACNGFENLENKEPDRNESWDWYTLRDIRKLTYGNDNYKIQETWLMPDELMRNYKEIFGEYYHTTNNT